MNYPCDAQTIPFTLYWETLVILDATSTPRTILNVEIQNIMNPSSTPSLALVFCGDIIIANASQDVPLDNRNMAYLCQDDVAAYTNSDYSSYGQIVYVNRDIATTKALCENPIYISEVVSTSTPEKNFYISRTIDLGQILILGFFVLAFLFVLAFSMKNLFHSTKIHFEK